MSFDLSSMLDSLKTEFQDNLVDITEYLGETTLLIKKSSLLSVFTHLKKEYDFIFLADITAVDYFEIKSPRYEMVYHLHRFGPDCEENVRLRIKAKITEDDMNIDSLTEVWSGADWLEREVYDMFGIEFTGHPDLRRILMPEDYGPYPLRKDFDVRNRDASKESYKKELEQGLEE